MTAQREEKRAEDAMPARDASGVEGASTAGETLSAASAPAAPSARGGLTRSRRTVAGVVLGALSLALVVVSAAFLFAPFDAPDAGDTAAPQAMQPIETSDPQGASGGEDALGGERSDQAGQVDAADESDVAVGTAADAPAGSFDSSAAASDEQASRADSDAGASQGASATEAPASSSAASSDSRTSSSGQDAAHGSSSGSQPSDSSGGGAASTAGASGASSGGASQEASSEQPSRTDTVRVTVSVDSSAVGSPVSGGTTATFERGATAYDALMACGLSVDASQSQYGVYVSAIGGLAEKQHGGGSGWTYLVNGNAIMTSCSSYTLQDGDRIQWTYIV